MAYRLPGWYKDMFQGFQQTVEELFPDSQSSHSSLTSFSLHMFVDNILKYWQALHSLQNLSSNTFDMFYHFAQYGFVGHTRIQII